MCKYLCEYVRVSILAFGVEKKALAPLDICELTDIGVESLLAVSKYFLNFRNLCLGKMLKDAWAAHIC